MVELSLFEKIKTIFDLIFSSSLFLILLIGIVTTVLVTGINYVIGLSRKSNEATYNSGQEIQNFFDEFDARQGNQNEINNM